MERERRKNESMIEKQQKAANKRIRGDSVRSNAGSGVKTTVPVKASGDSNAAQTLLAIASSRE